MNKYTYKFDVPVYTTILINGAPADVALYKNNTYELPKNDAFVKQLVAQGKLVVVKSK